MKKSVLVCDCCNNPIEGSNKGWIHLEYTKHSVFNATELCEDCCIEIYETIKKIKYPNPTNP